MIELNFHGGPLDGQSRRFNVKKIFIGRHEINDLVIPLKNVSNRHGCLFDDGGGWKYRDLKSSNGSILKKIDGKVINLKGWKRPTIGIDDGDSLILGDFDMEIRLVDVSKPITWTEDALSMTGEIGLDELGRMDPTLAPDSGRILRMLHQFMVKIGRAEDHDSVLRDLLHYAAQICTGANRAVLVELLDDVPHVRMAVDHSGKHVEMENVLVSRTVVNTVIERQDGLLFQDASQELPSQSVHNLHLRSVMAVPLWDIDRISGIVIVDSGETPNVFQKSDLYLLMFFVYHVSVSIGQMRLIREMHTSFRTSVKALLHCLDLRDPVTSAHCLKVQAIALQIAGVMNLPKDRVEVLSYAALLHDIGKIAIPDVILSGKERLNQEQQETMAQHSLYTKEILSPIDFPRDLKDVPNVAASHHERLDGKGPLGLCAEEIPLESRILAVADVFEALTSKRTYKNINSAAETFRILLSMAGNQLDAQVVEALGKAMTFL